MDSSANSCNGGSRQMAIRAEQPADCGSIGAITRAAFRDHPFSQQTEHRIVRALRAADALSLSLVATIDEAVVGHAAFSPITVDGRDEGWFGLGPVSVWPNRQRRGIGSALIRDGLARLCAQGAQGLRGVGRPAVLPALRLRAPRIPVAPRSVVSSLHGTGLGRSATSRPGGLSPGLRHDPRCGSLSDRRVCRRGAATTVWTGRS